MYDDITFLDEALDSENLISTTVSEAAGVTPVKKGKRWLMTIAKPGQGQMGIYPEEVLKENGPTAFPDGTKSYFTHEKRDPRDQVGTISGVFWNEEEGELQGYLTPFPRYAQVLDEAKDDVEASMHVASRKDKRTNIVKELVYHRANTVDLVGFGGLEGSGLKFQVESLFAAAAAEDENGKEEENMEITKEMWDGLKSDIAGIVSKFDTFVSESHAELQGKADEDAVNALVETRVEEALQSYTEVEKSIDDADIFDFQKESLKADARLGKDITDDLKSAVEIATKARAEVKPDPKPRARGNVVVVEESLDSTPKTKSFKPGKWSSR
jgi:hypothetical protein